MDIIDLTVQLFNQGVIVGAEFSAGPHRPAVPDGFSFEVCSKNGTPLVLCHDLVQVAGWYQRLAQGETVLDPSESPIQLVSDEELAAAKKEDMRDELWRLGWLP